MFRKYKGFLLYLFFGVITTLVNIIVYDLCLRGLQMSNLFSNIAAWMIAVTFAYVTNRRWVFESRTNQRKEIYKETVSFYCCRLLTGFLDLALMVLFVDFLRLDPMIMKCISNVIVIAVNYIASKQVIFKKRY